MYRGTDKLLIKIRVILYIKNNFHKRNYQLINKYNIYIQTYNI